MMRILVLQAGVTYVSTPPAGNRAWIRNLENGDWVLITTQDTGDLPPLVQTANYGCGKNQYEQIRKVLRDALKAKPGEILLDLCGDINLQHMNKPVTDHFGAGKFLVELAKEPIEFPIIGY